jgi:mannan endo-1,4-beta-mannosidase
MLPAALQCSSIDLMSVHAYVGDASRWGYMLPGYETDAADNNKLVYVEEFGVSTSDNSDFNSQSAAINALAYPWVKFPFHCSRLSSHICVLSDADRKSSRCTGK